MRALNSIKKDKKGDIESIIFIVVMLFVIGVVFLLTNDLTHKLLTKMEGTLNSSESLNSTYTLDRVQTIRDKNDYVWDYGFLVLFMGSLLALGLTAYSSRISPVFFWFYVILCMVVLALGVILSNTWQELASNSAMAEVIVRFPITNFILGTYYPTIITGVIMFVIGLLFGKTPDNQEGMF